MNTEKIAVEKIHLDPDQPRELYKNLEGLTESMKAKGFIPESAITVRPHPEIEGEYMVEVGHRRSLAAKKATILEIDCFVSGERSEKDRYEFQLMENEHREDLPTMNRVRAIQKGLDKGISEGRMAKIFGISVATLKSDLELISLAEDLHQFVDDGKIPKEIARKLATSFESPNQQVHVFNNAVKDKKTSTAMLAAIQAYLDKQNQRDIFSQAKKEAGENGGLKKARKASEKLEKTVADFEKNWSGDPNVVNARKREIPQLEQTAKSMSRIAAKLQDQITAFKAQKEMNAPAEKVVNE